MTVSAFLELNLYGYDQLRQLKERLRDIPQAEYLERREHVRMLERVLPVQDGEDAYRLRKALDYIEFEDAEA